MIKLEDWETIKKLLQDMAKLYYDWNVPVDKLEQAKGVNDFVDMFIKKVEADKRSPSLD